MELAFRQPPQRKRPFALGVVVMLHLLIGWVLVSGLARKVVEVVKAPIETKVIEEIKKPPPPPEVVTPPPPKMEAPPPPFIPPPEVQIQTPPPQQPTITATTPTPPPAPVAIAPVVPTAPVTPAPAAPAPVSASVVCSNYATVMGDAAFPREAARQGLEKGDALVQFTLTASGDVRDVRALRSSNPIFARNSVRLVGEYKCQGQGRDVTVTVPFSYQLE